MTLRLDNDLLQLLDLVRELASGTCVYLVGGAIRDLLLGRRAKDLDFVQAQGSIPLARAVSRRLNGAVYTLDDVRHSARVILRQGREDEQVLDFTSFIGETLEQDLRQRDFTINAIVLDLEKLEVLIDPLGGEADLDARQLRLCGPNSLTSDPIRVLRGVRLISSYDLSYGFEIIAEMRVAIKKLGAVSGERIRDELFKCLAVSNFGVAAGLMSDFGVFDQLRLLTFGVDPVVPNLQQDDTEALASVTGITGNHAEEQHEPFLSAIPELEHMLAYQGMLEEALQGGRKRRHLLLLCSVLLHIHPAFDSVKIGENKLQPAVFAEQISQALLTGQKENYYFKAVSGGFLRLAELSMQEPGILDYYRFFRDFGVHGLDSALLAMVEIKNQAPLLQFSAEICREVFRLWFTEQERIINPPRLVDGNILQSKLGIPPGAQIGYLLEAIREQQVLGMINTTEDALVFARGNVERKD